MSAAGEPELGAAESELGAAGSKLGARGGRLMFRSSRRGPVLSKDAVSRQGQITHLAFELLGNREAALAFLNDDNPSLGGRPLDLAMASLGGYDLVEQALRAAASNSGDEQ